MAKNEATNLDVISRLKTALLDSSQYFGDSLLQKAIDEISNILHATECSLWSVNRNTTRTERKTESVSLIYRHVSSDLVDNDQDYSVHEIEGSLFEVVLKKYQDINESYCRNNPLKKENGYKPAEFLRQLNVKDSISIPIEKYQFEKNKSQSICTQEKSVVAIFEVSFKEKSSFDWNNLVKVIQDFFSAAFYRRELIKKQQLMGELIRIHGECKDENPEILFNDVVQVLQKDYCHCEATSFFMWDIYQNKYYLIATTSEKLKGDVGKAYYQKGEGITGKRCSDGKIFIADNINVEEKNHAGKYCEVANKDTKSTMFIPITKLSDPQTVIGIFRFVNKKNNNSKTPDFFTDADVEIIKFASNYIALTIDYYLKEEEQSTLLSKVAHEFLTPANAIHKTAYRLLKYSNQSDFLEKNLESYLGDIQDFAEYQKWQAKTNLTISKNKNTDTFEKRYNIESHYLDEILKKAKHVVAPIARNHEVSIDDIVLPSNAHIPINVDEVAFVTIFYNLFTNAIKYRDSQNPYTFHISVLFGEISDWLNIDVKDYGMGITLGDSKKIFEMGYRSSTALETDSEGFGIGLSAVQKIVNDFGGKIWVSNLKKPTKFTIMLPKDRILNE